MAWMHKGIQINVTMHGTFTAKVAEVEVTADSLENVKIKIDKEMSVKPRKLALRVIGITGCSYNSTFTAKSEIQYRTLVGINRTSSAYMYEEKDVSEIQYVVAATPENQQRLEEMLTAARAAEIASKVVEQRKLSRRGYGGRIEQGNYEVLLQQVEESFIKSASEITESLK